MDSDFDMQSTDSTTNLFSDVRKPSKVRVILVVLLVLVVVLSVVFIALYVKEKNENSEGMTQYHIQTNTTETPTTEAATTKAVPKTIAPTQGQKTCSSPECVISAAGILQYLDTSVKPCDDFYQYSCGGFVKNHHIRDEQSSLTSFSSAQDFVDYSLKALMDDEQLMLNSSKVPNSAVYKALTYYKSCMNESKIEITGTKPMSDVIKNYGSWSITNQTWSNDSWILEKVLARALVDLGTRAFIALDVSASLFNTSEIVIQVGGGKSGFDREMDKKLSFTTEQALKVVSGYKTFMSTVFRLLGASSRMLQLDVEELFEMDNAFIQLKSSLQEEAAKVGYINVLSFMTLNELNNLTSFKFNWTVYFEEVFRDTNQSIKPNQKLLVALPNDIKNIIDLLHEKPKRLLANAIMWNVVRGFIISLPKSFREAESEYEKILTGLETPKPRWRACGTITNSVFEYATALLFANEYLSEDVRKRAADLFSEIKEQFSDGLEEQTWMDNKTRDEARIKVNAMKQSIGYPSFIKDPIKLNKRYERFDVSLDLFQNQLNIFKTTMLNKVNQLGKPPDNTSFPKPPVGVNAFYYALTNGITVLMGMLHEPFYESDRLKALNYGAIGMVIGHEITHGFDVSGSQFDDKGNLRSWWTKRSLDNYKQRSLCLTEQYNNTMVFGRKVDGVKTLSENIADNGGLKYAFRAYRQWRNTNGKEDKLPALDFNNDQLFFIGFAQTWCAKYREETIDLLLSVDTHALNPVRVRVPVHNFPEFSKAFGCKAPVKTCAVW